MRRVQTTRGAALSESAGTGPAHGASAGPAHGVSAGGDTAQQRRRGTAGARLAVGAVAVLVLALDVVSKIIVVARLSGHDPVRVAGGLLYLDLTRNSGAAFGIATGATIIFSVVAAAVVVLIVRASSRLRSLGWAVAFGLILGGACGNLTDRLVRGPGPLRGGVVDWISLFEPDGGAWPIFNLADAGIVCGGLLAVVLMLLGIDVSGARLRGGEEAGPP